MRFEVVNVTPELAAKFLDKNDGNRKLREHRSAYLSRAILEGKWKLTHQAAAISKRGRLLDGQHRFRAICLANKAAEMVIAYDVPEDVFSVMDAGMPRKMHERLRSDAKHTAVVTTMFKLMSGNRTAHEFEVELMLEIFEDALRAYQAPKNSRMNRAPIVAAIVLRLAMLQAKGDQDGVARIQWIVEKMSREDLIGLPPVIGSFYRQQLEGVANLELGVAPATDQFVRTWNAFDPEKESVTRLQVNDHAADVRAARVEFKLLTKGVFD
jgi:hypothetical protein